MTHDTRISLLYPLSGQPSQVSKPFSAEAGSITLSASQSAAVTASTSGSVTAVTASSVHITARADGQTYLVAYGNLQDVAVTPGQSVQAGDHIADAAGGDGITLSVMQVIDPTALLVQTSLLVQPMQERVRIRAAPVTGDTLAFIGRSDIVESLEPNVETRAKLGVIDQWLHVRTAEGVTGFAAAWFLQIATDTPVTPVRPADPEPDVRVTSPTTTLTGVNLDIFHPLGHPDANRLKGLGWVRMLYNVSFNPDNNTFGNTDVNAAHARYKPFIEAYAKAGLKVLLVFTHQTYGEGAGFNWANMSSGRWRELTAKFAETIQKIAGLYAGQNLVHAYQIWNEQDAAIGAPASVSMSPQDYAFLLAESIRAIRSVDRAAQIIGGGHTRGPFEGGNYARATIAALPADVRPDGLAFHPYGRGGSSGSRYAPFGLVKDEFEAYAPILPGKPLWITEWGVLDHGGDAPEQIAQYASDFVEYLKAQQRGNVASAMWYAWAEGMHNGYGLVGKDDQPRQPLFQKFFGL